MNLHFPKLRLPTFAEFLALFHVSTSVTTIVSGVERQIQALDNAIHHHSDLADSHQADAISSQNKATAALDEAARAARVSGKLSGLVA